jgi:hypothetical protein
MSENSDPEAAVIHLPSPLLHPQATDALLLAGTPYPPAGAASVKKPAEIVQLEPDGDRNPIRETERAG